MYTFEAFERDGIRMNMCSFDLDQSQVRYYLRRYRDMGKLCRVVVENGTHVPLQLFFRGKSAHKWQKIHERTLLHMIQSKRAMIADMFL